jgi:hypothetical protein
MPGGHLQESHSTSLLKTREATHSTPKGNDTNDVLTISNHDLEGEEKQEGHHETEKSHSL